MVTTKIYSPMTRNLTDNVLTPFYLIYYFIIGSDFKYEEKPKYLFFIVNLIISLIISFCSFVYNEFIVLFIFGLEKNTHDQISRRASLLVFDDNCSLNKDDEESDNSSNFKENESEK